MIVTTDSEFHSLKRQTERFAEDKLIELVAVPAEPFATLPARLAEMVRAKSPDMVFVSRVFFNSGYALPDLDALVDAVAAPERLVVIDGYHAFLARPVDLSRMCRSRILSLPAATNMRWPERAPVSCIVRRVLRRVRATPAGMPALQR